MTDSQPPRGGRSVRARAAALHAAWDLFSGGGVRGVTIEAIADRSGVAKTTIYRHWSSKNAVILDALGDRFEPIVAFGDSGSVYQDLTDQLVAVIRLLATDAGRAYLGLVAESWYDRDLAIALQERYIRHRRAAAAEVINRGVQRGQLPPDTDAGILIDALYGALYYRLLVSHDPLDEKYAPELVTTILRQQGL